MKKILLFSIIALFTISISNAQTVNIPDSTFKAYLVGEAAINTNSDTEIQVSEAASFTGYVVCNNLGIKDLTGIEAFPNISSLGCIGNLLTNLDVSANINLIRLSCQNNQLTTLSISSNSQMVYLNCSSNLLTSLTLNGPGLTQLNCNNNQLKNIDLTTSTSMDVMEINNNLITEFTSIIYAISLYEFDCSDNQLKSLDLSGNLALGSLIANNNLLTTLNFQNGNNANYSYFSSINNPNLTCIQVDDVAFSTTNWTNIDSGATFSLDCDGNTSGIKSMDNNNLTSVYPNPATSNLNIELKEATTIFITDVLGKTIQKYQLNFGINSIEIQYLNSGVYFIKTNAGNTIKFVKE